MDQAIIFCRTKYDCDNLEAYFRSIGGEKGDIVNEYSCVVLHGGKSHNRGENLQAFKNGEARFLICTDVAARGIDIRGVPYVTPSRMHALTYPPNDSALSSVDI